MTQSARITDLMDRAFHGPAGGNLTHFVRLHGVIHHDLYPAGQITLLKKLC